MPRKCAVCGSKQWHKEPSSGSVICSEGHILQNYRNETHETQELGPHTMRKRKVRTGRKKKEKTSKADPNFYHGARAQYHYFQCLQLLLRKQVAALVAQWNLPPEFETICRDIWTLHLSLLPSPPPPEPLLHEQDMEGKPRDEPHRRPSSGKKEAKHDGATNGDDRSDEGENGEGRPEDQDKDTSMSSSSSSSSDSDFDSEPEPNGMDAQMAELLRGLSDDSTDSEDENHDSEQGVGDHPGEHSPEEGGRRGGRRPRYRDPANTLAVLLVACWTMRLPVAVMDFIRLVDSYTLPYLDPMKYLPSNMSQHLNKHAVQSFSPPYAPTVLHLQRLASGLAKHVYASYGVLTPEMNAAPLLWRVVRALGAVLYDMTKTISHVLSLTLTLHHSLAPNLPRLKSSDPHSRKFDNAPPEVAFAAVVIVVMKLVYGLDGAEQRYAREATDTCCALPSMKELLTAIRNLDTQYGDSMERLYSARSNVSTADMNESEIDAYLDFCERALARDGHSGEFGEREESERRILDEYFPLTTTRGGERQPRAAEKTERRHAIMVEEDEAEGLRPGEHYMIYNTQDVLGAVPEDYAFVVRRAADWTGVDEEYIYGVIETYERRLARWWEGLKRRRSRSMERKREDRELL